LDIAQQVEVLSYGLLAVSSALYLESCTGFSVFIVRILGTKNKQKSVSFPIKLKIDGQLLPGLHSPNDDFARASEIGEFEKVQIIFADQNIFSKIKYSYKKELPKIGFQIEDDEVQFEAHPILAAFVDHPLDHGNTLQLHNMHSIH
jgi:hypothetical protein